MLLALILGILLIFGALSFATKPSDSYQEAKKKWRAAAVCIVIGFAIIGLPLISL